MAVVHIRDVIKLPKNPEQFWGFHIDLPVAGGHSEVYAINVAGWVIGKISRAVAVELVSEDTVVQRAPIDIRRPDVAAVYTEASGAEISGFQARINLLEVTRQFTLCVQAVLEDECRVPIGVIHGQRHSLHRQQERRLTPLLLTTLGRTGSTWLTRLLGQHPQIVAYRPFQYEPRVSGYWMSILKTLSTPESYLQPLAPDLSNKYWWLGERPYLGSLTVRDPEIQQWLGRDTVEALVNFCQDRIESFYEQVADVQGQSEAAYFVEKYSPDHFVPMLMLELYPDAREIFLVRDLRDMVSSILAYNTKRERMAFGREHVNDDEEYIKRLRFDTLSLLRSWQSRSAQAHLVRYEALILRPVPTLTALLEYLNLDSALSTVTQMFERASVDIPGMDVHRTTQDPKTSIGRWRRDLDPSLQAACQEAFDDILSEFGYIESDKID